MYDIGVNAIICKTLAFILGENDMIDISNAKYDFSKEELFAIKWFDENGYTGEIVKQYISKTIFRVAKDGITDTFVLPQGVVFRDIGGYMEQYKRSWELSCKIQELKDKGYII